jgi:hypothetical protein
VQNASGIIDGKLQVQFLRPLLTGSAGGAEVELSASTTNNKLIWAVHKSRAPVGTTIKEHTAYGNRDGNIFAKESAFTDAAALDVFVISAKTRQTYAVLQ